MAAAATIGAIMLAAASTPAAGAAAPGAPPLPAYERSIRCAGLAEAAWRAPGADAAKQRKMFDVALFWGLAASEAARKDGIPASAFTEDQKAAAAMVAAELAADDRAAATELRACETQTPPL